MRNKKIIGIFLLIGILIICIFFGSKKSAYVPMYNTPENIAQSAVYAYQYRDDNILSVCYAENKKSLYKNAEIQFEKSFFSIVHAKNIKIMGTELIFDEGVYAYVGVYFEFIMKKGSSIPYYECFVTKRISKGYYQVMTRDDYPAAIQKHIDEQEDIMDDMKLYQAYEKAEKSYAKKNPGYADYIYAQLISAEKNSLNEMKNNLRLLGIIFFMAIVELLILAVYSSSMKKARKIKYNFFKKKRIYKELKYVKQKHHLTKKYPKTRSGRAETAKIP